MVNTETSKSHILHIHAAFHWRPEFWKKLSRYLFSSEADVKKTTWLCFLFVPAFLVFCFLIIPMIVSILPTFTSPSVGLGELHWILLGWVHSEYILQIAEAVADYNNNLCCNRYAGVILYIADGREKEESAELSYSFAPHGHWLGGESPLRVQFGIGKYS